jgi:hypothetical protein
MKKAIIVGLMLIGIGMGIGMGNGWAASSEHDHGHIMGKMIRHTTVDGYGFMYHLLNSDERNTAMKGMEGMEMPGMSNSPDITNHLVVYITDSSGKPASGKIGFWINGPDGNEQKTLTMGMHNGYGADVIFKAKGEYRVRTKAVIDGKTLNDEFTYEVK